MSGLEVPGDHQNQKLEASPQSTTTSNWTINVSDIRTVKVTNISLVATEVDIREFFSFSGDIHYVEMHRETERSQMAYVTFKESQGAETALLLSGATIAELSVTITPVEDYHFPPDVLSPKSPIKPPGSDSAVKKAEDVVSSMLAKGFVLGKDALHKAKDFDERHQLISNASATVASLDQKIGLSEKLIIGSAVVNEKVREVNERFHVSEKTRSALAVAEQTASSASSALMSNRFVSTGASWVSGAFSMVAKAAGDVSLMTKEKVEKAEENKKEVLYKERTRLVNNYAEMHLDESSMEEHPVVPISSHEESKIGLI